MVTFSRDIDDIESVNFADSSGHTLGNYESSKGASTESESGETSQSDDRAPEALVRRENRAVKIIRCLAIFVLVSATVVTSYLIFLFARGSQESSLNDAFDVVASKLTTVLVADLSMKFWMANALSETITVMLRLTNTTSGTLIVDQGDWQRITSAARGHGNVNLVSWNPLLVTDQERKEFEELAQTQELFIGTDPPCFLCGTDDRGFTNPEALVEVTGFGLFPCGAVEGAGRLGLYPEKNCEYMVAIASTVCQCGDLPPGTKVVDNLVDIPSGLFRINESSGETEVEPYGKPPYLPTWTSAVLDVVQLPILFNQMTEPLWRRDIEEMLQSNLPVLSQTFIRTGIYFENYAGRTNEAACVLQYPVFLNDEIVGSISFDIVWSIFVSSVFPPQSQLVDIVVENSCGQNYTFNVNEVADRLVLKGVGDLHDPSFSSTAYSSTFEEYENIVFAVSTQTPPEGVTMNYCRYRFHVFSTQELEDKYLDSDPIIFAIITASIFIFTSIIFFLYDTTVDRRQRKVMDSANRTNAIVSSLFPKTVRDRLFDQVEENGDGNNATLRVSKLRMHSFLKGENRESLISSEPIADLFASATVMFLDIAGFTAWSSEREPSQVFQLLESVYQAFDDVAKKLSVFKVETIGDSYVAVCGLPTKRSGHAPVMVRFASQCLGVMRHVTRQLEVVLGPSTGDLEARVGLHSGPVTAGVLRGEKARFQLFGDTVNTASRIENTGKPGRIHASKATVDLLTEAGKGHWAHQREDKVSIKGKGELQTYWLTIDSTEDLVTATDGKRKTATNHEKSQQEIQDVVSRLVDWNVEVIYAHLERVVSNRHMMSSVESLKGHSQLLNLEETILENSSRGKIVIDEMSEMLSVAEFNAETRMNNQGDGHLINPKVKAQLREFVSNIACQYRDVPFHNFEHVSHVVMSASKLMNRILNPDEINYRQNSKKVAKDIHNSTFGVSSDPLLQFAVVFSALIHDVNHTGLTNIELNAMGTTESLKYRQQSVAEQNSVDIAWTMLMESRYKDLRACIYSNETELRHFRQCIVNAVMATDIADKRLKQHRESRWDLAFPNDQVECPGVPPLKEEGEKIDSNRKATIVYEYIIQASDVAHTMQHWHTYQKFNWRLFEERYLAWLHGHAEKEPSLGWYGGELWFFDNYIIPLAEKLNKCGVFGVSYDEYLTYAIENRKEWELKGKTIVEEMRCECERKHGKEKK